MSRIIILFIFSLACQLQILANDFKIPLEDGNQAQVNGQYVSCKFVLSK